MPVNDDLGKRMKGFYENRAKTSLVRRMPVAIRIDGKAFHTFTRGFDKPFDAVLMSTMQETMKYLCQHIQGCVFGYTQSDEITLILVDYKTLTTDAWFDYEVQKICSISASMATMAFNKCFDKEVDKADKFYSTQCFNREISYEEYQNKMITYITALEQGAMFDARCFNIPREEVANLIYWRQLDATRNSIQMVGQANFSHKELQNKSCNMIQDMLFEQKGINWSHYPTDCKRGSSCVKNYYKEDGINLAYPNKFGEWVIDYDMPIIKGESRNYVEKFLLADDEKSELQLMMGII